MSVRERIDDHRAGVLLAVLVLISVVLLAVSTARERFRPAEAGLTVVSSVQELVFHIGDFFGSTINSVRELGELQQQYDAVLEELRRYEGVRTDVEELRREVERLEQVLGFSESLDYRNLPARIVGKDPSNLFAAITIDKGSTDGMNRNMPVVAVQGGSQGLIGRIETVGRNTSIVIPLFDSANYVAARLQQSRYEGLVHGTPSRDGTLTMRYVSSQARGSVRYGATVVTSGMNSIYPAGIRIGTVISVQAKPYETSLQLTIDPIVDFSTLEYVFVITPESE
ncbi:MAG: rod shape-determining protein MreC [Spirochaetes bacterium]|nr:rod shape-determining protein MreC [Spirochaetota bacterium]